MMSEISSFVVIRFFCLQHKDGDTMDHGAVDFSNFKLLALDLNFSHKKKILLI